MINKEKILSDCRYDFAFWTCNSTVIRSIYELANNVEGLNDWGFRYHVNEQKNDFSKWVREVLDDEVLAERLENERNKDELVKKIRFRITEVEAM